MKTLKGEMSVSRRSSSHDGDAIAQLSRVKWEQMPTATLRDAIALIKQKEQEQQ